MLCIINQDIFQYENVFVFLRNFSPGIDKKGDYILSAEPLILKPGNYQISIEGTFLKRGSGYFLIDSSEEKVSAADFNADSNELIDNLLIETTAQLRLGISYDPDSGEAVVNKFRIYSKHVLYKESVQRHIIVSGIVSALVLLIFIRFIFPDKYKKWFPKVSEAENEKMLLILMLLTIITTFPFYNKQTYVLGDDLYYHLSNIRGMSASLKAGYYPVRIILGVLNNYGYGSGFYYPNLFLVIPACLILFGFRTMDAYEIFIVLCTFFAFLTMFLCVRRVSHSETAAYAGVFLYAFSAYRLADVFYRAALGEIQAFIFLPMIILGLYEIFHSHPERWWIFAFSFTGLLGCHIISLTLAAIITGVWALFHIRRIITDKQVFLALFKAVILTILLSSWFLFPMLEQNATNDLRIKSIMLDPLGNSYGQYTPWKSLFRFFYDWNYDEIVEHIYPEWWNYGISVRYVYPGLSLLLIPLIRIMMFRKIKGSMLKLADILSLYGFAALVACTDIFPWGLCLPFLFRIQFAWRFMMAASVLLCISCGIYASCILKIILPRRKRIFRLIPIFLLSVSIGLPILIETQTNRILDMDEYRRVERSSFLHGAEYLPNGFDRKLAEKTGDQVLCDTPGFIIEDWTRKGLSFSFDFRLPNGTKDAMIKVPLIFYTGYRAFLIDTEGNRSSIPVTKDEHGIVTVSNSDMIAGRISVRFERTPVQLISDIVSLITVLYCLLCSIINGFFGRRLENTWRKKNIIQKYLLIIYV